VPGVNSTLSQLYARAQLAKIFWSLNTTSNEVGAGAGLQGTLSSYGVRAPFALSFHMNVALKTDRAAIKNLKIKA
jgi:hypothetical protein